MHIHFAVRWLASAPRRLDLLSRYHYWYQYWYRCWDPSRPNSRTIVPILFFFPSMMSENVGVAVFCLFACSQKSADFVSTISITKTTSPKASSPKRIQLTVVSNLERRYCCGNKTRASSGLPVSKHVGSKSACENKMLLFFVTTTAPMTKIAAAPVVLDLRYLWI